MAVPGPVATNGSLKVTVVHGLDIIDDADTVILTGTVARENLGGEELRALRGAARGGRSLASPT
jgi:hypothetical protein